MCESLMIACHGRCCCYAAVNYRNGRSEAAIGRALSLLLVGNTAEQFPDGRAEITRDSLFIASKAGFLNTGGHCFVEQNQCKCLYGYPEYLLGVQWEKGCRMLYIPCVKCQRQLSLFDLHTSGWKV